MASMAVAAPGTLPSASGGAQPRTMQIGGRTYVYQAGGADIGKFGAAHTGPQGGSVDPWGLIGAGDGGAWRATSSLEQPNTSPSTGGNPGAGRGGSSVGNWQQEVQTVSSQMPVVPPPMAPPPRVAPPSEADDTAAEDAAFARSKDRVGKIGASAMGSLQREMANRGLAGSSIEGNKVRDLTVAGAGDLGQVARDQAIEHLHRQQSVADRNMQAELAQRNADMGFNTTVRGQDISAANARPSALISLINSLRGSTRTLY